MEFRRAIYAHQMKICEKMFGEIEVDENYFGAKRVRCYRGKLKAEEALLNNLFSDC